MSTSEGILFGIIAMAGWGAADFLVAKAVRKTSVFNTLLFSQLICLTFFFLIYSLYFQAPLHYTNYTILIILIAGFLFTVSNSAFYKGMEVGKVSIISPVSSCWAALTVILSLLFLNESINALETAGIAFAIIGTVLASFRLHDLLKLNLKNTSTGIEYAAIAFIGWGICFVLIDVLVAELNWFMPVFFIKTLVVLYLLAYSAGRHEKISFKKSARALIILAGALDAIAFIALGIGITKEQMAIVAPVSATYPVVTIILARIFFRETVDKNQQIGILSILAGLVMLSL